MRTLNSCWLALGFLIPASTAGEEAPPSLEQVYERVRQATVEVLVDGHLAGSGCFVEQDGLVLTAAHVLGQPGRGVEVLSTVAGRLRATLVAVDLGHDLVLFRVPPRAGGYPWLTLAATMPGPGSDVFLFGAPVFRHGVLQRGLMARPDLTFEYQSHFVEFAQVAALVQEGTSGAPWLNRQGELFGVQSGSISTKSCPAGVANVSPVPAVRALLASKRNAATPTLGAFVDEIWVLQADALRRFPPGTEGMVIQDLAADGPAASAGLKKNEVITAVAGQPIRLRDDFVRRIWQCTPGQSIELTVLSPDGTGTRQVTVPIGSLEVGWPQAPPP
jgi:S1-C subfamily serine protease